MSKIIEVEGIGEVYAGKLNAAGIPTTKALLARGASREGRRKLAEETGVSLAQVLKWVNHADLFRIKGVKTQYAELLEAAGVDSVAELAQRNPDNLHPALAKTNEKKKLVRKLPNHKQVCDWVAQAQSLPAVVTH